MVLCPSSFYHDQCPEVKISSSYRVFQKTIVRFALGLICLCFFVVSKAYSGSLVSYLTVDLYPKNMETMMEVALADLEYHAYGPIFRRQLLLASDERIRAMSKDVVSVRNQRETLQAVLDGKAVFYDSGTAAEYQIRQSLMDK